MKKYSLKIKVTPVAYIEYAVEMDAASYDDAAEVYYEVIQGRDFSLEAK